MMEVDIRISTSLEKISSPCNLTTAIGVASGAKLRLFRDPVREGQSRMAVCCDKPTASRLRHRFCVSRAYTHDGLLVSLTFVGMRPIVDRNAESLPRRLRKGANASAPQEEGGTTTGGGEGGAEKSSRARVLPGAGVEFALDWVEQAEADGRHVPGIADLYEEFMRNSKQCNDDKEKSREFMEDRGWTTPSPAAKTIHNPPRPRRRWWSGEEKGEQEEEEQEEGKRGGEAKHSSSATKILRERKPAASHHRCRQRPVVTSVEDVTSALNRISSNFADAPKPVERLEVVSLLAKIYADGTAFVDNRPRCCEALDRLGIARWHARTYPRSSAQASAAATTAPNTAPSKGWLRVMGGVVGLVRAFIDFGAFVQVYVAAAERERIVVLSMVAVTSEEKTRENEQGQGERELRLSRQRGDKDVSPIRGDPVPTTEDRHGLNLPRSSNRDQRASPETSDAATETIEHNPQGGTKELPKGSYPLPWLFPNSTEEGGRLAFNRHALCGSAAHALITLEAAASIVRDAGRVFPSERAWRWCCENKALEGGRLLTFQDFVEVCEGLKEHLVAASFMSPEDSCTSAAVSPVAAVDLP